MSPPPPPLPCYFELPFLLLAAAVSVFWKVRQERNLTSFSLLVLLAPLVLPVLLWVAVLFVLFPGAFDGRAQFGRSVWGVTPPCTPVGTGQLFVDLNGTDDPLVMGSSSDVSAGPFPTLLPLLFGPLELYERLRSRYS